MKMRERLRGTRQVFSFTLRQFFRSRANNISLLVSLLVILASMPVMTYVQGGRAESDAPLRAAVSAVALDNRSDLPLSAADLARDDYWAAVTLLDGGSDAADITACVSGSGGAYSVSITGEAGQADTDALRAAVVSLVEEARLAAAGITAEQLDILWSDYQVVLPGAAAPEEALAPDELSGEEGGLTDGFWVQYGYAIVVMMLCLLSSSYVIRAVMEEKGSKLVELLLLSVQPLALLTGKILAAMVYTFGMLLLMVCAWAGSLAITAAIFGADAVGGILSVLRGVLPSLQTDPVHLLVLGLVLLLSLLLGYLTMSMVGGLSGACCGSMDDMGSAAGTVTMVTMAGYLGACVVSALPGRAVAVFSALCPVLSIFCAPVQYVRGNIGGWLLLLSWLIQALLVAALAWLSARVYADLIIHRGNRIKMKELLRMAGSGKEAAR